MKLWLLERIIFTRHSDNLSHSLVVRCETEQEARELAHADEKSRAQYGSDKDHDQWFDPALTSCVELLPEGERGCVVVDFYEP